MKKEEYCPDCCIELTTIRKKPDKYGRTIWLNCPHCGYTSRPKTSFEEDLEMDNFKKTHKLVLSSRRIDFNKY